MLSWRVLALQGSCYQPLYQQFHLDEPWDSPHNLTLLEQIPNWYQLPRRIRSAEHPFHTIYRAFVGPGTAFDYWEGLPLDAIEDGDGATLTVLVAEAAEAVPWTKPDELSCLPDQPLPAVGGLRNRRFRPFSPTVRISTFQALFADGHVQSLPLPQLHGEKMLRGMITWNGGEEVKLP